MKQIQAGSSVESKCGKCKTITDHHVVVMDGSQVARVECKVCGARHAYKPSKSAPAVAAAPKIRSSRPASTKAAATKVAPTKSAAISKPSAAWEQAVAGAAPVPYDMAGSFQVGDVITHPVFGLGAVQKVIRPNTMEVLFADGMRNLRCQEL